MHATFDFIDNFTTLWCKFWSLILLENHVKQGFTPQFVGKKRDHFRILQNVDDLVNRLEIFTFMNCSLLYFAAF